MATVTTQNPTNPSPLVPTFPGGAKAITPADADSFATPVAVYVGVGGNVQVRPANGAAAVLFKNAVAGTTLPVQVIGVDSSNTTATDLVAVY